MKKLNRYAIGIDASSLTDHFLTALGIDNRKLREKRHECVIVFMNESGRPHEAAVQKSGEIFSSQAVTANLPPESRFRTVTFIDETSAANAVQQMFIAGQIDNGQKEALKALARIVDQNTIATAPATPPVVPQCL